MGSLMSERKMIRPMTGCCTRPICRRHLWRSRPGQAAKLTFPRGSSWHAEPRRAIVAAKSKIAEQILAPKGNVKPKQIQTALGKSPLWTEGGVVGEPVDRAARIVLEAGLTEAGKAASGKGFEATVGTRLPADKLKVTFLGSVSEELKKAVKSANCDGHSGIVGFMLAMVERNPTSKITYARFLDPSDSASWHYKSSGKLENRQWLKARFRAAGKVNGKGAHEWIGAAQIGKVIKTASAASEAKDFVLAAQWINLQHDLRSETAAIIFNPSTYSGFKTAWSAGNPSLDEMSEMLKNIFSGHVGALYLKDGPEAKPVQKVGKQGQWHKDIDVKLDGTPLAAAEAIQAQVADLVWDGLLKSLPKALKVNAHKIEQPFVDSRGKPLTMEQKVAGLERKLVVARTLSQLGERQQDNFEEINKMFTNVISELA